MVCFKLIFVVAFAFTFAIPNIAQSKSEEGSSSMWHVFRQVHESDVAKRPYLAARKNTSPNVIEKMRIIPATEPKPLAPSTIITRIKALSTQREMNTEPPKSTLSSVWALKMSGRMSESDIQSAASSHTEHIDSSTSAHLTVPKFTIPGSDQTKTEASGKPATSQVEHVNQKKAQANERNQSQPENDQARHTISHAEKPFNDPADGSGRRTQQTQPLKLWEALRRRLPERWVVFNKPGTNGSLVQNPIGDTSLGSESKAPLNRINNLEEAPITTSTQLPEQITQRNESLIDSSEQQSISVNGPSKKRLIIRVDNATFYTAINFLNGTLILQRVEAPENVTDSQSLDEVEIFYPGIGGMIQGKPFQILINWSGVVVANADSVVASTSKTTETIIESTFPPSEAESTTEMNSVGTSDKNITFVNYVSEEDAETLTTTMPTATTDEQLSTPLFNNSENSALTHALNLTTNSLEPAASARSFVSISSSSSSSSVSSSNGISYVSQVSSSYSSANPGSVSLNTRTSTTTSTYGNTTTGNASGSVDLTAPDNSTSMVFSSDSPNSTVLISSRVIQPARFWAPISHKNRQELSKHPRTAEISQILPLNFFRNHSVSSDRTSTMSPLLIFMKGSSPIVLAASPESFDTFTTPKPDAKWESQSTDVPEQTSTNVTHYSPTKLKTHSFLFHPKSNSPDDVSKTTVAHRANLTSLILAHTAALISGRTPPVFLNSTELNKMKPSARQMESDSENVPNKPKVHVIMATALADPPESEFRERSLDYHSSRENIDENGSKYDAYWAVPTHGQLVETPNGYVTGSSPEVSSHQSTESRSNVTLPAMSRLTCGQNTSLEEFVLTNPGYPDPNEDAGRCEFRLHIASQTVCQVRLEFKDSRMLLPRHGSCLYQQMSFSGSLIAPARPKFCGWNADQHFYLELIDAGTGPRYIDINVNTKAAGYRFSYALLVQQIDCREPNPMMAPSGCFQYFHSSHGEIKSFNFEGGQYWSEQNYKICIRTTEKTCAIAMTSANGNFGLNELTSSSRVPKLSGRTSTESPSSCNRDYLLIPGISRVRSAEDQERAESVKDRVCGTKFGEQLLQDRSGVLIGPLDTNIYIMEFHAGTFRRYETRHFGPGFAINYTQVGHCPE